MINLSRPPTLHSLSITRPGDNDHPEEHHSAHEEMGTRPWPGYPGQSELDRLETMADSRWLGEDDDLPGATYEMVLQNAMSSVPLLEKIGRDASFGIDRFGRLRCIHQHEENYNGFFCDLVAKIQQRLERKAALQKARVTITEKVDKFWDMVLLNPPKNGQPHPGKLRTLYNVMADNIYVPDFNLLHLHAILSRCQPALWEVSQFGTLTSAVRQDLEKGRTPRRWDQLSKLRELLGVLDSGKLERAREEGTDKVLMVLERDWETVGPMYDCIKTLKSDLEAAIKEIHKPWCGLSDDESRDGAANN